MAEQKLLLGNVRGPQGEAGPNTVSSSTTTSGFENGHLLYNNNGKVGAKTLTPQDIGAAAAENGVSLYVHQKSGTVHTLTGSGDNLRFVATADFAAGDTIQVNGQACTVATAAGDALWNGFFRSGAVVVCYRTGNRLTFNGGGLPAAEAAKLAPENLKTGVSITANGKTVTGSFTADGTVTAGQMLAGAVGYAKGKKITGSIPSRGAAAYRPGTVSQTIADGQYLSGAQTIQGDGNLVAGNIRSGVSIFGVAGTYTGTINAACVIMSHQNYDFSDAAQYTINQSANIVSHVSTNKGVVTFKFNLTGRVYVTSTFFKSADKDAVGACSINGWVNVTTGKTFTITTTIGASGHGNNKRVIAAVSIAY